MGLSLLCGDEDGEHMFTVVGSYSTNQELRAALLIAVRNYIENNHSDQSELVDYLKTLIRKEYKYGRERFVVDYEHQNETLDEQLSALNLKGFHCFIFHNDCEGYLFPNEASDFLDTLHFAEQQIVDEWKRDETFYLKDIFEYCYMNNTPIVFT